MTAQINDTFRYRDNQYALAAVSDGQLFDIAAFDLQPMMTSTSCHRGYQAEFAVTESRLVLDALHVNLYRKGKLRNRYESESGSVIHGVASKPS